MKLSERDVMVLRLRYLEKKTFAEIADVLHVTPYRAKQVERQAVLGLVREVLSNASS